MKTASPPCPSAVECVIMAQILSNQSLQISAIFFQEIKYVHYIYSEWWCLFTFFYFYSEVIRELGEALLVQHMIPASARTALISAYSLCCHP